MQNTGLPELVKRVAFSLFLAIVACGIVFYLFTFFGMMIVVFTRGVNPADVPMLNHVSRKVALPLSLAVGAVLFVIGMRRRGTGTVSPGPEQGTVCKGTATSQKDSGSLLIK